MKLVGFMQVPNDTYRELDAYTKIKGSKILNCVVPNEISQKGYGSAPESKSENHAICKL